MAGRVALLLDRDGTINVDRGWVYRSEDFVWIEGAREAIKWANERGILVIVITNQGGIARGHYTEQEFCALTAWINRELTAIGAHVDATYHCPHHPTEGRGEYRRACRCRKPAPGLIKRALAAWGFDPARSVMIGDAAHDVEAAAAVGIRAVRFCGGSLLECVQQAFQESPHDGPGTLKGAFLDSVPGAPGAPGVRRERAAEGARLTGQGNDELTGCEEVGEGLTYEAPR